METHFTGGCACGAVRYNIAAQPMMAGHCQCLDCQRATGAGHASIMAFPASAVNLTGQLKFHEVKGDSGGTVSRGFCAACGSFLMAKSTSRPNMAAIAAGSLDDGTKFRPQMVVYTSRAQPWDHIDPALPRFPRLPPRPTGS